MKKPRILTGLPPSILAGAAVVSIVATGWMLWAPAARHAAVSPTIVPEEPQSLAVIDAAPLANQPARCWLPDLGEETQLVLTAFPSIPHAEDAAEGPQLLQPGTTLAPLPVAQDLPAPEAQPHPPSGTEPDQFPGTPLPQAGQPEPENASAREAIQPSTITPDLSPRPDPKGPPAEPCRSGALEQIAREADAHTRSGFRLAGRGAHFSARAEFIMALRLVAQGLDRECRAAHHSQSLADGLVALGEAEDFLPAGSHLEADLDLESILAGHRTPVLKAGSRDRLTALSALQQYLTYAQQRLAAAASNEVAGSMALYALGKLHATLATQKNETTRAPAPKAMVFYQAALLVFPKNHLASNDLGVLLGQAGRFEQARIALEHSVSIQSQPENWQNLAKVYAQLGASDLAHRAQRQSQLLLQAVVARRGSSVDGSGIVHWIDAQAFRDPAAPATPPCDRFAPVMTAARPMPAPAMAQPYRAPTSSAPPPPNSMVAPQFAAPHPTVWATPWPSAATRATQMPSQYRK